MSERKVLMAGLLPPPLHGQSIATAALFGADLAPLEPVILPLRFSRELGDVGRPSLGKVVHLAGLVLRCWRLWLVERPRVLYYTPGSANMVPFLRDVVFLLACRPLFRITVLHYHAGGLPDFLACGWRRRVGRWTYGRGAWAVGLSKQVPVPGLDFGAARDWIVANGLEVPAAGSGGRPERPERPELRILFVGNLFAGKGVLVLAEAACVLAAELAVPVRLTLVGAAAEAQTQQELTAWRERAPANLTIEVPGVLEGPAKWQAYADADMFAFPSFYQAENQPLVIIEAMACGLPVVATRWRGIPDLVGEGVNGLLVEPRGVESLVAGLRTLALDASLRKRFGARSRQRFEEEFSVVNHVANMKAVLGAAVEAAGNQH